MCGILETLRTRHVLAPLCLVLLCTCVHPHECESGCQRKLHTHPSCVHLAFKGDKRCIYTHLDEHLCACVKHITVTDGDGEIDSESEEYKKAAETAERRLDAYLVKVRACRVLLGVNWATDHQMAGPRPNHWNPQARHTIGTRTHQHTCFNSPFLPAYKAAHGLLTFLEFLQILCCRSTNT